MSESTSSSSAAPPPNTTTTTTTSSSHDDPQANRPDLLDLIRSSLRSLPSEADPSSIFSLLDRQSNPTDSLSEASFISIAAAAQSPYTFQRDATTRLLRSKDSSTSSSLPDPSSQPSLFFPLESIYLAIKLKDERAGSYLARAASSGVASFPALDRVAILDYLLGKRSEWEGVVPLLPSHLHPSFPSSQSTSTTSGQSLDPSAISASSGQPLSSSNLTSAAAAAAAASQSSSSIVTSSTSVGLAPKRPYVPNKADVEFVKRLKTTHEVVLRDRNDSLRGTITFSSTSIGGSTTTASSGSSSSSSSSSSKLIDFGPFRKVFSENLESARKAASRSTAGGGGPGGSRSSSGTNPSSSSSQPSARKVRAQDPIIVISNSPTSLLNMFNIKQYLEEGIFVPPEEARARARGVADLVVSITSRGGTQVNPSHTGVGIGKRILVVDNAEAVNRLGGGSGLSSQDPWSRVVAVFTTGQTWQFKTYKWSEPRELFKNVMGVYVRWHNEPPNPNVRDWNVTELQVDRSKRHTDKQVVSFFWRSIETWTQRRKPHLIV
ncbi:CDC73-domain-containing protein [Violaceomyces palustris]|uniref:CDC73-domain-containing protein n=1 Tax=Violaceomyces palustris TaxID=1673888 RepID=A0ACD0P3W6_9BASI|nr:CDC73-domain-containing protein [Violaceomyces palustris]